MPCHSLKAMLLHLLALAGLLSLISDLLSWHPPWTSFFLLHWASSAHWQILSPKEECLRHSWLPGSTLRKTHSTNGFQQGEVISNPLYCLCRVSHQQTMVSEQLPRIKSISKRRGEAKTPESSQEGHSTFFPMQMLVTASFTWEL